jgi:hypothetical protein
MQAAIDRGLGVSPIRPRQVVRVMPRPAPTRVEIEPQPVVGPSKVGRLGDGAGRALWFALRWMARLPRRFSRRLSMLVFLLLLVMVINVPVVTNGLLEQAIDIAPWTGTTVQTDILNLRASPGIDGAVISTLEFGTDVSITGLPENRGETTWWPIMVDGELGWVSGEYLDETRLMQAVQLPRNAREAVGGRLGVLIP